MGRLLASPLARRGHSGSCGVHTLRLRARAVAAIAVVVGHAANLPRPARFGRRARAGETVLDPVRRASSGSCPNRPRWAEGRALMAGAARTWSSSGEAEEPRRRSAQDLGVGFGGEVAQVRAHLLAVGAVR